MKPYLDQRLQGLRGDVEKMVTGLQVHLRHNDPFLLYGQKDELGKIAFRAIAALRFFTGVDDPDQAQEITDQLCEPYSQIRDLQLKSAQYNLEALHYLLQEFWGLFQILQTNGATLPASIVASRGTDVESSPAEVSGSSPSNRLSDTNRC